jgi:hypothetical protein
MKALWIVFAVAVVVVFATNQHRPAKTQDRLPMAMDPIDMVEARLADLESFCSSVYYPWRETSPAGGIREIDNMCFAAQTPKP